MAWPADCTRRQPPFRLDSGHMTSAPGARQSARQLTAAQRRRRTAGRATRQHRASSPHDTRISTDPELHASLACFLTARAAGLSTPIPKHDAADTLARVTASMTSRTSSLAPLASRAIQTTTSPERTPWLTIPWRVVRARHNPVTK